MDKYICIHGHFYQPPRENPWLEAIEIQDSAYPYHDWNERVNAECYAPNTAARIMDGEGRILNIVSNYSRINFNFGPTVLSWMETYSPETYQAILDADKQSIECRSGHGNAIAQPYNHIIMPLANNRDKRTQIIWGIKDFEYRFKRPTEGMWLPEMAVNKDTLELLAEHGIKFTLLAPHQALRVRKINTEKWDDVSGGQIDPTRAYRCRLLSGRVITVFFYDGYISSAVAFEKLLNKGENFVNRLLGGFSDSRQWPQLVNIATDGETYGHHHRFGEMALAFAINHIESRGLARLTNYGEYLEKYPPTHEVEIVENTSWSCSHGVERWKNNCGCNSGGRPGWHQEWRKPLRNAMDWLGGQLELGYEDKTKEYLKDPWESRDAYIDIILNRSEENINTYFERHAIRNLNREEKVLLLELLEIQRHAMLMYTSCGWFFDELSGIETVQVLQYAGRAVQLSEEILNHNLRESFLEKLSVAKSNMPEYGNGENIYEKFVKPGMIDLKKVGVHYAVSSLFEDYPENTSIYCYSVTRRDYQRMQIGRFKLAIGWICLTSKVTWKSECISFSVVHLGDHVFNGGVHTFPGEEEYQLMTDEINTAFKNGVFADIIRLMDTYFGTHNYSIRDLFRDEQRKILNTAIGTTIEEFETSYRLMYENNSALMDFLLNTGVPIPRVFYTAAEFTLNLELKKAFEKDPDNTRIQQIVNEIKKWNVSVDSLVLEFVIRCRIEGLMDKLYKNSSNLSLLQKIEETLTIFQMLPLEINLWYVQNIYFRMSKTAYKDFLLQAKSGDKNKALWIEEFQKVGKCLFFNIDAVLPKG
jgi:alpha-amylase/alpha-mannosidase (GH57 family)